MGMETIRFYEKIKFWDDINVRSAISIYRWVKRGAGGGGGVSSSFAAKLFQSDEI